MPLWKNYYLAQSIPEALTQLTNGARVIAGGTDLLLEIQQGIQPIVDNLVDVCNIPELNALEIRGDELFIGAAVPLNHIVASPLVMENAQALVEACNLIGGPQVRNTATLGGNVAHALPAADGTIALLALDARAEAVGQEGSRITELEKLFLGPRRSTIEERQELLVGFYLPLQSSTQSSAFRRVMRPQGVALPVLNIAIWLERNGDKIEDARLALGPSGPVPIRARKAEEVLQGEKINPVLIDDVYEAMLEEVQLRTSPYRASADYRSHLAKVLLQEVLEIAWNRTGND
jgi:carbon-monoxide dehydrogenase medium subunit